MNFSLDSSTHKHPFVFFRKVNKKILPILFLNSAFYSCGQASMLVASYVLGRLIDALTLHNNSTSWLVIALILCIAFHEIFYRSGHICEVTFTSRMRRNIKQALFDHTASLSFGYFADRFAGEIAHKVSNTADAFERMVITVTNSFIENIVLVPLSALTLSFVHYYYGIFVVVWSLVFVIGSWLLAKEMNRRAASYAAAEAKTTGTVVDVYGNIGTVKVYGSRANLLKTHEQFEAERRAFERLGWWDILTFNFQGTSIFVLCTGMILITIVLYGKGIVTIGSIVFISTATLRLFNLAWDMGKSVADPAIIDGDHIVKRHNNVAISYRDVTFGYSDTHPILSHFSITIKEGEKVGIVGLSGAGKTTFANLLLRFFDPQQGSITLNQKDIREMTQESLRSHISYISQDTSLFHASIADNIAYGSSAVTFQDIKKAAELAYADEFIKILPHNYESVVGERGIKLSGGQRQRIAIARALLANRPLFLLDEATSSLDSDSEDKIQKGLIALMENKTVIAIAHRLSTLSHMDRIVFFEGGKIVEDGTHEQLLALNGKYAQLWRMQAGGFLPNALSSAIETE